jgi:citrate synthase
MADNTTLTISLPPGYKPGLEGIIAGTSSIGEVNPEKDALIYRGYPAHELAEKATYEEVAYLLLHDKLPSSGELKSFEQELAKQRPLSDRILNQLKQLPPKSNPMVGMSIAVSLIHLEDPTRDTTDVPANLMKAKSLIAKAPTIVAALSRLNQGKPPLAPNPKLGHASNFLYMILGKEPDSEIARVFDSTNILYAEHGYNASTFASLVTASTLSDMYSAVTAAIAALKGPLHGGANEAAIEMLLNIGDESKVEEWVKGALERKEKIMGFGHRVYKKQDSRAPLMKKLAEKMAQRVGDKKIFALSCKVEDAVMREKGLFPNVDYHCAVAYYLMGLPIEIYTPIFAMARMIGWTSHIVEQHAANRLIRPACFYIGPRDLQFVPIDKRK